MDVAGDWSAAVDSGHTDPSVQPLAAPVRLVEEAAGGGVHSAQRHPPPVSFGLQPGLGASGFGIFRLSCLEQ